MFPGENPEKCTQIKFEKASLEHHGDDLIREPVRGNRALDANPLRNTQFSSVSRIPIDVLKLIFEEAYQPCRMVHNGLDQSGCNPLVVTHVSRRWRNIVLSLPTLWTCLHVEQSFELLKIWIQRSRNPPLRIVELETRTTGVHRPEQIALLVDHALRWKSVYTQWLGGIASARLLQDLQDPERIELPRLELVYISKHISNFGANSFRVASFPKLKILSLIFFEASFAGSNLSNLRHLTLKSMHITGRYLRELSIAAPQLIELTLSLAVKNSFDQEHAPTFLALKALHFVFCGTPWDNILRYINVPSLETLTWERSVVALHAIDIIKILPCLTQLRLALCRISQDGSIDDRHLLYHNPSLRFLEVTDCTNVGFFLDHLSTLSHSNSNSAVVVPELHTLAIGNMEPKDHDALVRVVRGRDKVGLPLQELKLGPKLMEALGPELRQTLSELVTISEFLDPLI